MQIKEKKCEPRSNSYGVVNITAEALSNRIAETPLQALGKKVHFSDKPTKELSSTAITRHTTVAMSANETFFFWDSGKKEKLFCHPNCHNIFFFYHFRFLTFCFTNINCVVAE